MSSRPLIFIIAGEASGDQLGAELMMRLKELTGVRFAGIGGPGMSAQGLTSLFPMEELSIMGIEGILRQLPHLLRRLSYTVETIQQLKPDAVVTIDAPEFSFRVLKRLHKLPSRPRLIHYVAPTVWAWRPGRARKISYFVDRLLCLYPFEPPYFEKHGLKTVFVGHPVGKENTSQAQSCLKICKAPSPALRAGEEHLNTQFITKLSINKEGRNPNLLCVLPGSRSSEIKTLLPIFGETIKLLKKDIPNLSVIIPTLSSIEPLVRQGTQSWPIDVQIVVGDEERQVAFQKSSLALAASGTVALQLAAAGRPFIIAYKVGKINEWIGRALLKTPWACMVNILLAFHTFGPAFVLNPKAKKKIKESWIPEFLQEDCNPENLKAALIKLFKDPEARDRQEYALHEAITLLKAPPQAGAMAVLEEMENHVNKS